MDWIRYNGEYKKKWYDVRMHNGMTIKDCWPNAGMFHSQYGDYIPSENVQAIRETDDPFMREVDKDLREKK